MRPIAPRTGAEELTVAEHQEQYQPVTVALYQDEHGTPMRLLRYTFTAEDRARIATGEDVYVALLGGGPMTPISAQVGPHAPTNYVVP